MIIIWCYINIHVLFDEIGGDNSFGQRIVKEDKGDNPEYS
jgi:hypothetical protein